VPVPVPPAAFIIATVGIVGWFWMVARVGASAIKSGFIAVRYLLNQLVSRFSAERFVRRGVPGGGRVKPACCSDCIAFIAVGSVIV